MSVRGRGSLAPLALWLLAGLPAEAGPPPEPKVKNVIVLIADGAGFNTFKMTSMYEGKLGRQVYDGPEWVAFAVSTYPLRIGAPVAVSAKLGQVQFPHLVYDPVKAWDTTPVAGEAGGFPYHFAAYKWLRETAPDSAATASAIFSGKKSYNGAINVDGAGVPTEATIAQLAKRAGKRIGAVTDVPFSHATPAAAGGAHNADRRKTVEIAGEMLLGDLLDVIAGCGHPDYDNNGRRIEDPAARSHDDVGGQELWRLLATGKTDPGGAWASKRTPEELAAYRRWKLRESRAEIEELKTGPTPDKLLIVPQVGEARFWSGASSDPHDPLRKSAAMGGTLQQQRASIADPRFTDPGQDPKLTTVPTLATLALAALNALDDDPDGFFLHVEAGAVDWAMHGRQAGRMIEEMMEFNRAIEAIVAWIEQHSSWSETLLVLTADHDHLLWGPNAHTVAFDPPVDNGAGKLPSYRWLADDHSNSLVPLHSRGRGSERFAGYADREDPFYGSYLDQIEIYEVLRTAIAGDR